MKCVMQAAFPASDVELEYVVLAHLRHTMDSSGRVASPDLKSDEN